MIVLSVKRLTRKQVIGFSLMIITILLLFVFRQTIFFSMANILDSPYDGSHADIVVVEGGNIVSAVFMEHAIDLVKQEKADKILIVLNTASGAVDAFGIDNYSSMLDTALDQRGISSEQYCILQKEIKDPYTRNSAIAISEYFKIHSVNIDTLLLLQDTFHIKRSLLAYTKVFKTRGIYVVPCSVTIHVDAKDWWKSLSGIRRVYGEYAKMIYYKIKGYI